MCSPNWPCFPICPPPCCPPPCCPPPCYPTPCCPPPCCPQPCCPPPCCPAPCCPQPCLPCPPCPPCPPCCPRPPCCPQPCCMPRCCCGGQRMIIRVPRGCCPPSCKTSCGQEGGNYNNCNFYVAEPPCCNVCCDPCYTCDPCCNPCCNPCGGGGGGCGGGGGSNNCGKGGNDCPFPPPDGYHNKDKRENGNKNSSRKKSGNSRPVSDDDEELQSVDDDDSDEEEDSEATASTQKEDIRKKRKTKTKKSTTKIEVNRKTRRKKFDDFGAKQVVVASMESNTSGAEFDKKARNKAPTQPETNIRQLSRFRNTTRAAETKDMGTNHDAGKWWSESDRETDSSGYGFQVTKDRSNLNNRVEDRWDQSIQKHAQPQGDTVTPQGSMKQNPSTKWSMAPFQQWRPRIVMNPPIPPGGDIPFRAKSLGPLITPSKILKYPFISTLPTDANNNAIIDKAVTKPRATVWK